MRFALTDEQRQFGSAVHELLADAEVPAAARAWADGDHGPGLSIWRDLAESGITALAVPESSGGAGASPVDLVVACEELGHHPVPGPIAESIAAVPALLTALIGPIAQPQPAAQPQPRPAAPPLPAAEQRGPKAAAMATARGPGRADDISGWLAGLAAGELIATVAAPPVLPYALDADVAGLVLLTGPGAVWQALPRTGLRSADPARRIFEIWPAQAVATGKSPEIGAAIATAIRFGTLASAALLLGAGRGLLDVAAAHARTREQFGRPVGSFQAVKHSLADVLIGLEFARPLLYAAAIAVGEDARTAIRDVSAARVACADAARRAARTALQVHGAIGYTRECDVSLWLAKVRALSSVWGGQAEHRATVLAALAEPETGPWN